MSVADRYATFANFGGGNRSLSSRPLIKRVVISECIKRRLPSKHYVYKMVVEWTTGNTCIVYRRYSMFFDFQVKLQELYATVCQRNPQFAEKVPHLPELPGKILFGRSHIHQVAEKRRGKIEEFCQQVVSLPPEISQTNLVMGFFNTWPEDTMLPSHNDSVSSTSSTITSASAFAASTFSFPLSPTSPISASPNHAPAPSSSSSSAAAGSSAMESIITHPDEMENLEQYRVMADYQRKDSHQVNLAAGQVVHVIEKHDTGWWMVMSEDEQGYAPAAYLEPLEGASKHSEQMMDSSEACEVYKAMEGYIAQNEDEVGFRVGDRIEVISKSLDGWWKIRCCGKVGLAPSALIRKEILQQPFNNVIYESHKSIYEELNIHRPPPRRNTIERSQNYGEQSMYAVPRPILATGTTADDLEKEESDYAEPPLELGSDEEGDTGLNRVPQPMMHNARYNKNRRKMSAGVCIPSPKSSRDTSPVKMVSNRAQSAGSVFATSSSGTTSPAPQRDFVGSDATLEGEGENSSHGHSGISDVSPYEPVHAAQSSSTSPVYQNTEEAWAEAEAVKNSLSMLNSPICHNRSSTSPPPQAQTPSLSSARYSKEEDYVDIDSHDEYVNPEEFMVGEGGGGGPHDIGSPISQSSLFKPLPKPPLPSSNPPKKKPHMMDTRSLSISEELAEDEYIPMEPIYTEPPMEDPPSTAVSVPAQQRQLQKQVKQSKQQLPSPVQGKQKKFPQPSSQSHSKNKLARDKVQISSPILVDKNSGGLKRAKSLENLLAANNSRESSPQRVNSPPGERKSGPGARMDSPSRVPILPPGRNWEHSETTRSIIKPKPGKIKSGKAMRRETSATELSSGPVKSTVQSEAHRQSTSPPHTTSPEHHSVKHTTSVPLQPLRKIGGGGGGKPNKESIHLKTYIAVSDYQCHIEGCLSFQGGDKCVLLRKTQDGWWLVNIGGREGWTPEGFWREETWTQGSNIARPRGPPPTFMPQKRHADTTALDLSSSVEGSQEMNHSGWAEQGPEKDQAGPESRKPIPPPPPPQNTKPAKKGPPPPKPKPLAPNSPWRGKGERPPIAQKPTSVPPAPKLQSNHRNSPTTSPPLPRRQSTDHTPSPPPPPPPKNEMTENSHDKIIYGEYVMLEDARTLDNLESAPWFVGKMDRNLAEQFLMEHGRQREFLVRERTARDGYYALSIRYHYSCKHFNIDPTPQGNYAIGTLKFPTIAEIVHHYQNNSLFIHEGQHVTLSTPARRRTRGTSDVTRTHS